MKSLEYRVFCKDNELGVFLHIFNPNTLTCEVVRFDTMSKCVNACKQRGIDPLCVQL